MSQPSMCVIGSLNMDINVRTHRFPRPGESVQGENYEITPGGKGANQAVAAVRTGARVAIVGRIGRDEHGKTIRSVLQRERIDVVGVGESWDEPTGVAIVSVDEKGENAVIAIPGANSTLDPGDVDEVRAKIAQSAVLLLQFEVPEASVMHAAEIAKQNGTRVVLNVAPARKLPDGMAELVDLLIVNVHEARSVTGYTGGDGPALERALSRLPVPAVVLTRGKAGAVLLTDTQRDFVPVFPVDVVDTFGAGDSFIGAMAAEWATRSNGTAPSLDSLPDVLRFASAAGSLATTSAGALAGTPRRDQIQTLLDEHPVE